MAFAAIDRYPKKTSFGYDNRARFRALVFLVRYAGLRITDATAFDFAKLNGRRVFLYHAKMGRVVSATIPPFSSKL